MPLIKEVLYSDYSYCYYPYSFSIFLYPYQVCGLVQRYLPGSLVIPDRAGFVKKKEITRYILCPALTRNAQAHLTQALHLLSQSARLRLQQFLIIMHCLLLGVYRTQSLIPPCRRVSPFQPPPSLHSSLPPPLHPPIFLPARPPNVNPAESTAGDSMVIKHFSFPSALR